MSDDSHKGICDLCRKSKEVRYKNIYWNGSEGLTVCLKCELKIVNFVRELSREWFNKKKIEMMKKKGLIWKKYSKK